MGFEGFFLNGLVGIGHTNVSYLPSTYSLYWMEIYLIGYTKGLVNSVAVKG